MNKETIDIYMIENYQCIEKYPFNLGTGWFQKYVLSRYSNEN